MAGPVAARPQLSGAAALAALVLAGAAAAQVPHFAVASAAGSALGCLRERAADGIAILACRERCAPIPWQLDERDAGGRWALGQGPDANPDVPLAVVDDNDEVVWMAADAGRRAQPDELPAASCAIEIEQRVGVDTAWIYGVALAAPAPRASQAYVAYDPDADRITGEAYAIGFAAATPRFFAARDPDGQLGPNLLDRLKVRASARLLGLIPLGRDEDDILYDFGAWHAGPVRVLRREYQWVRLTPWLRTPIFETETIATRDALTLPVRLRLNFPPTRFFAAIEVQAALDFRDLRGWGVRTAATAPAIVGSGAVRIDQMPGDWLLLDGPSATLALGLVRGPSLASTHTAFLYREGDGEEPPEAAPGEWPAVGYRLTEWSEVDRGDHWFAAETYALPPGSDLDAFLAARRTAVEISVSSLASSPSKKAALMLRRAHPSTGSGERELLVPQSVPLTLSPSKGGRNAFFNSQLAPATDPER